ncbi:MAG: hypothetical protein NXH75_16515 [Halobacteriovoraceae bacterium]|nr:hypothetical protein [Halobacteriovoraceae bacterium]
METFYFLAGILVGCTLLVAGIQNICNNLLEMAELPVTHLIKPDQDSKTKTFFKGILISGLSGSTLTTISTLMGLVNGGLLRVKDALIFMSGAHLGPLILLFMISILNFKAGMVFLSAGFFAQFLARGRFGIWFQNTYGLLLGLGMAALGRYFLTDGLAFFSNLDQQFLGSFTDAPFLLSLLTGLAIGSFFSYVFRSSLVALLLIMAFRDSANFNLSLLLPAVVGVHTLNFFPIYKLSQRGSVFGKRLAYGQLSISLIGLAIGSLFLSLISWDYTGISGYGVLLFFAILRLVSVFFFLLFFGPIRKILHKRWPDPMEKNPFELENIGRAEDMVPAMSLIQSSLHLNKFKNIVDRLFNLTEDYIQEGEASGRTMAKIKEYERITDNMYKETSQFLGQLTENSLTSNQAMIVQSHQKIADSLENIADYVDKIASYNTRYLQGGGKAEWRNEFLAFYRQVKEFYLQITINLPELPLQEDKRIHIQAQKLKIAAEALREEHLKRLQEFDGDPLNLMTYSDMVVSMRKIRGHTLKLYQKLL